MFPETAGTPVNPLDNSMKRKIGKNDQLERKALGPAQANRTEKKNGQDWSPKERLSQTTMNGPMNEGKMKKDEITHT